MGRVRGPDVDPVNGAENLRGIEHESHLERAPQIQVRAHLHRAAAGLTQAEVAEKIGTTQSAIARLESGAGRRQASLGTLRKYAQALGCRLELRLIKEPKSRRKSTTASTSR